jgi:hypothetical protein
MDAAAPPETLIHEIGGMLVRDEAYLEQPWDAIALVARVDPGAVRMHGFAYLDTGEALPEVPSGMSVSDRFRALRDAMQARDGRAWRAALVQIRREGARITVDFEYDDPARWAVTPLNLDARREELRPK